MDPFTELQKRGSNKSTAYGLYLYFLFKIFLIYFEKKKIWLSEYVEDDFPL